MRDVRSGVGFSKLLVTVLRLAGRASSLRQGEDSKDAHLPVQRKGDHRTDFHFLGRLRDPLAVETDMTGFDQILRKRPAFQQPDEEQESIETHWA